MQPSPSCLVAAEAQNTLQTESADTVLLVGHIPHRHKPRPQRLAGVLKDRPRCHRRLPLATTALKQPAQRHPRLACPLATRADETVRPAQAPNIFMASRITAEPLINLLERPRVINPGDENSWVTHIPDATVPIYGSEGDTPLAGLPRRAVPFALRRDLGRRLLLLLRGDRFGGGAVEVEARASCCDRREVFSAPAPPSECRVGLVFRHAELGEMMARAERQRLGYVGIERQRRQV